MAQASRAIYWSALLADFRRSGMTHVQFCRARRISLHSFRNWLYRLRPASPSAEPPRADDSLPKTAVPARSAPPAFLPLQIRTTPTALLGDRQGGPSPLPFELVLGHDWSLRIPASFDPDSLRRLLDVLEERP
jgi:hypothetical protein